MLLRHLLPKSLIGRVFLLYLGSILLLIGGGTAWYAQRSFAASIVSAQDSADTLISLLGPVVSEAAVIGDYDTIARALERAAKHADINAATFIDLKGGHLEKRAHGAPAVQAPTWLREMIAEQLPALNLVVIVGGRDYGVLRLSFSTDRIAAMFWQQGWIALGLALAGVLGSMLLVWRPLNSWLGNLGQIRAFGEQLQVSGGSLAPILAADAPVEFRRTFEALNQAASSLQLERERAALTLAAIGDGIATTDAQGRIVFANPVLGQMLARAPQVLLGQRIQALLPELPADLPVAKDWTLRLRSGRTESTAHTAAAVLDLRASVIAGPDGQTAGWVLAFRDISQQQALEDRLQAEVQQRATAMQTMRAMLQESGGEPRPAIQSAEHAEAAATSTAAATSDDIAALLQLVQALLAQLRERSEQLATIFALSPDGFVSFDANRVARYVSPAFTRLSGMAAEKTIGQHQQALLLQLLDKGQNEAQTLNFEALRLGKRRIELERPTRRVLELSLHEAAPGGASEVAQLLHVSDVTHQVEVEQMKSEFLSTAAHELRTPMASIYGFTELLMAREVSVEKRRDMLSRIYRQSEAMIAILNELLDLARIEARRGKDFELEVLDLNQLVEEVLYDFAPPNERAPPLLSVGPLTCRINVDRNKLKQVLRNLLSNAYKYSGATGRVWVRVVAAHRPDHGAGGSENSGQDEGLVCIEVEDEGIGMSAEELSHVTERFYRADKSGAVLGTGLGMSIVKEIVELMDGQLRLRSTAGLGTTVAVLLPQLQQPAGPAEHAAPRRLSVAPP